MDVEVVVAGAGPVGLTVATELVRRGISVRIVDRLASPPQYAKAVGLQPRTLEMWERSGLLPAVLDEAVPIRGQIVYVDGEQVARLDLQLPPDVPYGFLTLPQYVTERLLTEQLRGMGTAVERPAEVVSFEQDADGVAVRVRTAQGETVTRAAYLVGADGAHSAVRKGLALGYEGDAFSEEYMLGDVEVDWDQPAGYGIRSLRHRGGEPDDILVAIPLPGRRRYRMTMLAPPELATPPHDGVAHGFEGGRAPELHHLQATLDRLAPEPTTAGHLRWSSVFRISHRLVERYGVGRVFLAGDAAHIHPPTGAQGMNTGIQDGIDLAWKLALAVEGAAAPGLLESYHAERRPVGEEVVGRTVRHARAGLESDQDDAATVIRREAQLLVAYPESPLVASAGESLRVYPGDRAPDARGLRRPAVTDPVRLFQLLAGTDHVLLCYLDAPEQLAEATEVQDLLDTLPARVRMYAVCAAALRLDPVDLGMRSVVDADGELAQAYGLRGGDGVLVRPDGWVGWTASPLTADALATYLPTVIAMPGGPPAAPPQGVASSIARS